ncbi:helix-turn-helix transcriptional regulator [Polyangium fumosum]|nr:helix-turn-helix domain-containing protein [Polyangium fumosum]
MDDMLDYAGAAELTGLARGTLRSMVARRQIPHIRLGARLVRFQRKDLERWLRQRLVPSKDGRTQPQVPEVPASAETGAFARHPAKVSA